MQFTKDNNNYTIRIARGENVIFSLESLCKDNHVEGGYFSGIGAIDKVDLAHYNVETQKYSSRTYKQAFEVTNITGTIGIDAETGTHIIHAHITLSDTDMNAFGGHLVEARVSGTLEILLTPTKKLIKKKDAETGLKLFEL